MTKITDRMIRAMSLETRQKLFNQEKNEFVREHMHLSPAAMDAAIKELAKKWKI